jgi:hypothetical protein
MTLLVGALHFIMVLTLLHVVNCSVECCHVLYNTRCGVLVVHCECIFCLVVHCVLLVNCSVECSGGCNS